MSKSAVSDPSVPEPVSVPGGTPPEPTASWVSALSTGSVRGCGSSAEKLSGTSVSPLLGRSVSAEDAEDRGSEAQVEQAHVRDHEQHENQHHDEIVDQLLTGRVDDLAQLPDGLADELQRRRTLPLDRLVPLGRCGRLWCFRRGAGSWATARPGPWGGVAP